MRFVNAWKGDVTHELFFPAVFYLSSYHLIMPLDAASSSYLPS